MICGNDDNKLFALEPSYSLPTLIGEWNDKLWYEDMQRKFVDHKRRKCMLLVARTRVMLRNVLDSVELSTAVYSLNYNNIYQIIASELPYKKSSMLRGLYLSAVMNERDIDIGTNFMPGCLLSASPEGTPCRRNCFLFKSVDRKKGEIHYGDFIYIQICRRENELPLYVRSEMPTVDTFGCTQEVRLTDVPDMYCQFKILQWSPEKRKLTYGTNVLPDNAVVIQQVSSGQNLSCEIRKLMPTFFGLEASVSCNIYRNAHRVPTAENVWKIIGKREPDKGMMIRAAKGEDIPEELLNY